MRYGENRTERRVLLEPLHIEMTLAAANSCGGKELSFNNINDTNGALDCSCLRRSAASKHANRGVSAGHCV